MATVHSASPHTALEYELNGWPINLFAVGVASAYAQDFQARPHPALPARPPHRAEAVRARVPCIMGGSSAPYRYTEVPVLELQRPGSTLSNRLTTHSSQ